MSLQLTIPARSGESRVTRVKPREVRDWLENLPTLGLQRAATLVNEQLRVMNRQVIAPAARLETLAAFLDSYCRLLDSVPVNTVEAAPLQNLLKRLSQNIGFGYKIVVHELVNGRSGMLEARHVPAALLGALHALGLQLEHYYAAFQRAPLALWNECLAIYRYARKTGRAGWQGTLPGAGLVGIEESFRLTALLRLADPYSLPAGAARALESYFRARIDLVSIETDSSAIERDALLPLLRGGAAPEDGDDARLFIDSGRLMQRINADIEKLEQARTPRALDLPELLTCGALIHTLKQVSQHWQIKAVRRSEREAIVTRIEMTGGLDAAWCVLNKGRPFDPSLFATPDQDEVIDLGVRAAPEPVAARAIEVYACQSVDRSKGGLRVSYRGDKAMKPSAGQLYALRRAAPAGSPWVVAVCRWLAEAPGGGVEMGLQYLAREHEAVVIRPLDNHAGEHQPALSTLKQRGEQDIQVLIARAGQIALNGRFLIYSRGQPREARCTRLLESGYGFDRLIYDSGSE